VLAELNRPNFFSAAAHLWAELKPSIVVKAVDQWWPKLRARVRAKDNTLNSCLIETLHFLAEFYAFRFHISATNFHTFWSIVHCFMRCYHETFTKLVCHISSLFQSESFHAWGIE